MNRFASNDVDVFEAMLSETTFDKAGGPKAAIILYTPFSMDLIFHDHLPSPS